MSGLPWIDWVLAERVGTAWVPPGPVAHRDERAQLVRELRAAAARAPAIVGAVAQLPDTGCCRELVVDRARLVRANLQSARSMLTAAGSLPEQPPGGGPALAAGRGRGVALGAVLAFLGSRILGQFDPFAATPTLLLSAPSIMAVERQLGVVPSDFRMWVVLHEQTHRVQFAAAPWLRELLGDQVRALVTAADGGWWRDLADQAAGLLRARRADRPLSLSLVQAVSAPEQAAALDRITAVMSLLEGHADVMMDRAGVGVIPSLWTIRSRFNARRARGGAASLLGRLLGMDAKLQQYADGARFCRTVLRRGGLPVLNRVFSGPEAIPSLTELLDPDRWLRRIDADGQA